MKLPHKVIFFFVSIMPLFSSAQIDTKKLELEKLSTLYAAKEKKAAFNLQQIAKQKGWALQLKTQDPNKFILLTGIDSKGFPIYTTTDNNIISAATTHTNQLWNGGSTSYNLSGSSLNIKGKLAVWDGGIAKSNHIELDGKIVNKDGGSLLSHSTHVAGTLVANGINTLAKGMAYNATQLDSYDFNSHISEMSGAASNLLLSNHSYGVIAGWNYTFSGDWEFWGNPNDSADYKFGIYNDETQMLDSISYNAPYYLIVKSSGNNRDKNGPPVGTPYKRFDINGNMVDVGNRPTGISSNNGYDIIPTYGVAKNVLTVGGIEGIASGSTKSTDIKMSSFSSWGPTDDGRIKPDLVAAGVDVLSCTSDNITSYGLNSGTSMATPNVTGSLYLLQEFYSQKNSGAFMKASTLKALAIHTASETGISNGPDYQFGWGLLNVEKAAKIINAQNTGTSSIIESTLNNGATYSLNVIASGDGKLMATIVWTDPVGTVTTTNLLNNSALKLIHDLDIRIIKSSTIYFPWVLNPATPSLAATKGDNFRDNVERVEVDDVIAGQAYTIQITHKGILQRGSQVFSLILSGVGGTTYCTSTATQTAGTRIDNVIFAGINNNNPAGCTQYNNYTNLSAQIEPNKAYPLNITVSTCDASSSSKIIKVFIDYNSNGSFADAGELVATSGVITTNTTYSTNITIPNNLVINNISLMRVVVQETTTPSAVTPCGTYLQGETQDYSIQFITPANDISITEIAIPTNNNCSSNNQYVSVRVSNVGNNAVSNIPLNAIVKNGVTTIANLTGSYVPLLASGASVVYTFQTPFTSIAATTYTITASTNLSLDQNALNNSKTIDIVIAAKAPSATGDAKICGATATLRAFNTNSNQNYLWYNAATATNPIAAGTSTTTSIIASTYYIGSGGSTNIGAVAKTVFADGDYQAKGGNYFKYTSTAPTLLENAILYTAYPGKVHIIAADIKKINADGTYTYNVLDSITIDVVASRPTQATGDIAGNDATDLGRIYNINLLLPSGSHVIIVTTDNVANIFRNKNIASNPYPYSIPNVFTITGNNATTPNSFYYYLYNMSIKTLDCASDRVAVIPVTAAAPTITKVGDSLVSSDGVNYQWVKDGVDIVGEINQKYKPIANGNYSCSVTDVGGCKQTSNTINILITPPNANDKEFIVYPNPATNAINIKFNSTNNETMQISIADALGKICLKQSFSNVTGNINKKISITNLAGGVYVLSVFYGDKTYREKFVIIR